MPKEDAAKSKKAKGFSDDERAAMKERAREMKEEARGKKAREDGENDVLAAIAALQDPERSMAARLHELIKSAAPELSPKTWYGQPAYTIDGKVVCFFQPSQKFNTRYATLGFSDVARLDDGDMWPAAFALKGLTPAVEARIVALVKKALS